MAKFEAWLDERLSIVEDDPANRPIRIVLEGPSGEAWGSWPAKTEGLKEAIHRCVVSLGEELPKGTHSGKIIAYSDSGGCLSTLPVNVSGKSVAASSQASEAVSLQRAMALAVANLQTTSEMMKDQLERSASREADLADSVLTLTSGLHEMLGKSVTYQIDIEKEAGRQRRLDVMTEKLAPMLDLAAGLLGVYIERHMAGKSSAASAPADPTDSLPSSSPPSDQLPPPAAPAPPVAPVAPPAAPAPPVAAPAAPAPPVAPPADPAPPTDLASFDAQRSLGGSRKGRKSPSPVTRVRLALDGDPRRVKDRRGRG